MGFTDKATAGLKKMGGQFDKTSKGITGKVGAIGGKFKALGASALSMVNPVMLAVAAVAAVGVAAKKSISAFADFEDAMAGVKKTTGMSDEAIRDLGDGIKEMTKTIPLAHTELADISAVAGQLGIQGKENILAFTETAAKMATAFDMPAERAATVAAKLTNIYGLGIEKASNLASAINVLGNTTAASESQISDYAMSLGASAVNMGFSSTEAVSMGASLISMGMDASDAGTRLNSAFTKMGKNVEGLADFLEITGEEFSTAFGEDPMAMVIRITEKLGAIEDPLERAKMSAELFGLVGGKAITGLGGNLEGLQTNLDNAAQGFIENTSLEEEFAAKTDTLKAKFQLLKNALNGAAITIGTSLAPYVEKLALGITKMVPVIMKLGAELKERLTPAFNLLRDFLKDFIPRVKDLISHLVDRLQPAFESVKNIGESLGKIFGSLTTDLGDNEDAFATLTTVMDIVVDVLNWLAAAIESVVNWFAEHPTITKFAIAIAAAVLLITTPILAIIAALALLAVAWDNDWLGIKTTTHNVTDAVSKIIGAFLDAIKAFWDAHGEAILKTVSFIWDAIKLYIDLVMAAIGVVIDVAMALIQGDWEGAWDAIGEYVGTVATLIKEFLATWGTAMATLLQDIGTAIIEALITGIKDVLGALKDIITGEESITSTIVKGIKSIVPKAKVGGEEISESVADGIEEKKYEVEAAVKDVTDTIDIELETAPPVAEQTGLSTALSMADGIKSGTSAVSAAAKVVVDAAMAEMDRLWAIQQARKAGETAAADRAARAAKNIPEGTRDIVGQVISGIQATSRGQERITTRHVGTIGTGKQLKSEWEGDIEDIRGKYYITETAWGGLTKEQRSAITDNIIDIIADDWKKSITVGKKGGSKLYKRFIKESAFWSKEERYLADLQSKIDAANVEIEHLLSLGMFPEVDLLSKLEELEWEMIQFNKYGMPSAATGGFVAQDTSLNVHKGEWVIPTRGGPVMTGGKDITLNMTYNIDKVAGVSDLERIMEKHDRELFKKLRALV